jgi:hypothetical protein
MTIVTFPRELTSFLDEALTAADLGNSDFK